MGNWTFEDCWTYSKKVMQKYAKVIQRITVNHLKWFLSCVALTNFSAFSIPSTRNDFPCAAIWAILMLQKPHVKV